MTPDRLPTRRQGQTLFIALIVLFVLLVLGLVFTGLITRNIRQADFSQNRSASSDLSEAGIRYAHSQLLNSASGADWRGELVDLAPVGVDTTLDPDMLYLRPGTGFGLRDDADNVIDMGGPDGLGHFTRVNFANGRALIRVRYAPSDPNIYNTQAVGQFSQPGTMRNYLIIESIGRTGRVNTNDPTTLNAAAPVQFRNYPDSNTFRQSLGRMRELDNLIVRSRRLVAFASIGMLESSRFIMNVDRTSRPADLGTARQMGIQFEGTPVSPPLQLGGTGPVPRLQTPTSIQNNVDFGGSIYANADLRLHGDVRAFINASLGDGILTSGLLAAADNSSRLDVAISRWNTGAGSYQQTLASLNVPAGNLNSRSGAFLTQGGVIRDGMEGTDSAGFVRGAQRKEPPLMSWTDPQNGVHRYTTLTRESGAIINFGNSGRFGHGDGVFVNNSQDRQIGIDENTRSLGSENSLVNDWFNPGNTWSQSGWKGQYYVPRGAFVRFFEDGFAIFRDNRADARERTWRRPDGSDTGSSSIRYRIGYVGVQPYIVNTYTPGVNINQALTQADLLRGRPFNGVLYFEGNVRVRGVIPTDIQLTLVSNATIYIEGSITKGVIDTNGQRLSRPSRSSLMLMARDYVVLNTTMFFGPMAEPRQKPGTDAIEMAAGETIELQAELLLDPNGLGANPINPSTWAPFAYGGTAGYQEFTTPGSTSGPDLATNLVFSHTADDPGGYAMFAMDVNYGIGTGPNPTTYLFALQPPNSVYGVNPYVPGYTTPGYAFPDYVPLYALGSEIWQRYPKFETRSFPIIQPGSTSYGFPFLTSTGGEGRYRLLAQDSNVFTLAPRSLAALGTQADYLLSRAAIVPHDIRIEAALYAERGSFVVIPGYWFNSNPNDTRQAFNNNVQQYVNGGSTQADAVLAAQADRVRDFGAYPITPFYQEPINARVEIFGSISENMPLPVSYQTEWMKKWGWMPRQLGALYRITGSSAEPVLIPWRHVPPGYDLRNAGVVVPNLIVTYDPMLATGRVAGFADSPTNPYVRVDGYGRALPPMPKLPVSPTLSYFGEVLN